MLVDLKSRFFEVEIYRDDKYETAFSGQDEHYQYKRMPMRCKDSPNIFLKAIALGLAGLQGHVKEVYLNDIMVFASDLEEHESGPVLITPDLEKPFIFTMNVLDYAIGANLSQGEIGNNRLCEYVSCCLKGSKLCYPTYDKELLATAQSEAERI
ncbi:uncharacterized protein LOC106640945 [Copidosoma floridanum]|uniref:uncharacterized protein LOC106640945 n=1 Tax=Copidosoma floridanum TaxID=29053 RepID=UPI0006C9A954|nr:uncharacterized protein LOC106640945 [Copidosoma floridanum]